MVLLHHIILYNAVLSLCRCSPIPPSNRKLGMGQGHSPDWLWSFYETSQHCQQQLAHSISFFWMSSAVFPSVKSNHSGSWIVRLSITPTSAIPVMKNSSTSLPLLYTALMLECIICSQWMATLLVHPKWTGPISGGSMCRVWSSCAHSINNWIKFESVPDPCPRRGRLCLVRNRMLERIFSKHCRRSIFLHWCYLNRHSPIFCVVAGKVIVRRTASLWHADVLWVLNLSDASS